MEAIGDILAPYSETLGKVAGIVASCQMLTLGLMIYNIYKRRSSAQVPFAPFCIGCVLSVLALKLGHIMGDAATVYTNLFGFSINVLGVMVWYVFAPLTAKNQAWGKIGLAGLFSAMSVMYGSYEDPKKVEMRFGLLLTALLVILVGLPLLNLPKIIANKSTEGLPFPMIASGCATCLAWLLYGLSIKNHIIVYQNLFLLFLSSIQLSLFAIYPSKPTAAAKKAKKASKKD